MIETFVVICIIVGWCISFGLWILYVIWDNKRNKKKEKIKLTPPEVDNTALLIDDLERQLNKLKFEN